MSGIFSKHSKMLLYVSHNVHVITHVNGSNKSAVKMLHKSIHEIEIALVANKYNLYFGAFF